MSRTRTQLGPAQAPPHTHRPRCCCPCKHTCRPPAPRPPCRYFLRDGVKEPLGIGDVLLEDNSTVKGFIGEAYAVAAAADITSFGGWRAYLADSSSKQ